MARALFSLRDNKLLRHNNILKRAKNYAGATIIICCALAAAATVKRKGENPPALWRAALATLWRARAQHSGATRGIRDGRVPLCRALLLPILPATSPALSLSLNSMDHLGSSKI